MATNLFTPILNDKTRWPSFFNGRLLSGEAMTDEQRAQKVARELLSEAVGDGVVYGLTLEKKSGGVVTNPTVTVKSGLAVNRCGEILLLATDTEVQLVRPAHVAAAPSNLFQACQPPQSGTYVADDGVYLLTLSSIGAGEGLATVNGLGNSARSCNIKYLVDAVEFRLLELPVDATIRADTAHLRNRLAYLCFGGADLLDFATDPFASPAEPPHSLLDDIRTTQLTDCDVPLGVMYWTATGGIQFLDLWSVRRRVTRTHAAQGHPAMSDRRRAIAEAMVLQFQEETRSMQREGLLTTGLVATDFASYLPPLGLLPLSSSGFPGVNYGVFFSGQTIRGPAFVAAASLQHLFELATDFPPIVLGEPEVLWLYIGVENMKAANATGAARKQGFVAFANGRIDYLANARFNQSRWNYSNYALI